MSGWTLTKAQVERGWRIHFSPHHTTIQTPEGLELALVWIDPEEAGAYEMWIRAEDSLLHGSYLGTLDDALKRAEQMLRDCGYKQTTWH